MLVELTIEANEESFVIVLQHGGNDVTWKRPIDPLYICSNAANLDTEQYFFYRSENFFCIVLQIGCIPTDVKGVYTNENGKVEILLYNYFFCAYCKIPLDEYIISSLPIKKLLVTFLLWSPKAHAIFHERGSHVFFSVITSERDVCFLRLPESCVHRTVPPN